MTTHKYLTDLVTSRVLLGQSHSLDPRLRRSLSGNRLLSLTAPAVRSTYLPAYLPEEPLYVGEAYQTCYASSTPSRDWLRKSAH